MRRDNCKTLDKGVLEGAKQPLIYIYNNSNLCNVSPKAYSLPGHSLLHVDESMDS